MNDLITVQVSESPTTVITTSAVTEVCSAIVTNDSDTNINVVISDCDAPVVVSFPVVSEIHSSIVADQSVVNTVIEAIDYNAPTITIGESASPIPVYGGGGGGSSDATAIGGVPVMLSAVKDNDVLRVNSGAWRNTQQTNLTDGGNF